MVNIGNMMKLSSTITKKMSEAQEKLNEIEVEDFWRMDFS